MIGILGIDDVLSHLDEYSLYCYYLGFEPEIKVNYNSPIRNDDQSASWGIFATNKAKHCEFMWKDSGGRGQSGDIFVLVKIMFGYETREMAASKILSDFGLGPSMQTKVKLFRHIPSPCSIIDIRILSSRFTSNDLTFWKQWNINQTILDQYRTSRVSGYWMSPLQRSPVYTTGLSYVYRIFDKYQLYFPTRNKGEKFRNDLLPEHVMGYEQLNYNSDTLVITKSYKDVMCLRSFGYDAVSPRSENTPLPDTFFPWADRHYKHKVVLFDNDMRHQGDKIPYSKIYIPLSTGSKDISDFTRDYSPQHAAELLRSII